jgi:predicted AAA+ superfamily ATPase
VLTGSTRHDSLPAAAQSLTGRLSRLTVFPLSQGEITGTRERLLERLFADAGAEPDPATAAAAGLHRLAGQTAQVLNVDRAARGVGLDASTTESYVRRLEAVFLIHRLPAWGKTLRSRAASTPKLHVLDSGVASRLLRLTPDTLARTDPTALTELGHLLETFVAGELLTQASWLDGLAGTGHWRTHDGDEVDLVVERDDGAILAFEVKVAGRVPGEGFKALRKLRTAAGDAFVAGVALYTGSRSYNVEDRLHVMPVDRLWSA